MVLMIQLDYDRSEGVSDDMIAVNLYYTGENGNARKFAEEMERGGTAALIRSEKGNLRYEYFFPMSDPETVLLIDIWEDQAAIDAHHSSPMMTEIVRLREKFGLRVRAERFITDADGIPESDMKFIEK